MGNIYDNEAFFEGYKKIRANPYSGNNVVEIPVLFDMMPNVEGKRVLDLGCGYGDNCQKFIQMGASSVVGVDVSIAMLDVARSLNCSANVEYVEKSMEEFDDARCLLGEFDVITSSLAMHYVARYDELIASLFDMLADEGTLLFSQEHPIFTAPRSSAQWVAEGDGKVAGFIVKDYPFSGYRNVSWIVDNFEKYHRTLADIINPLIRAGFRLDELREPSVEPSFIDCDIALSRCLHVPDYLFVKASKPTVA